MQQDGLNSEAADEMRLSGCRESVIRTITEVKVYKQSLTRGQTQ